MSSMSRHALATQRRYLKWFRRPLSHSPRHHLRAPTAGTHRNLSRWFGYPYCCRDLYKQWGHFLWLFLGAGRSGWSSVLSFLRPLYRPCCPLWSGSPTATGKSYSKYLDSWLIRQTASRWSPLASLRKASASAIWLVGSAGMYAARVLSELHSLSWQGLCFGSQYRVGNSRLVFWRLPRNRESAGWFAASHLSAKVTQLASRKRSNCTLRFLVYLARGAKESKRTPLSPAHSVWWCQRSAHKSYWRTSLSHSAP